jgi:hypothetical protein
MNKVKAKYTLPSMMESYISYFKGEITPYMSPEEINFENYLLWESPVLEDSSSYRPICDMKLISQIAEFSDPRRTFLDYWFRNHSVPTELDLPDFKSESTLDLISEIEGYDIRSLGFDRGSWYTRLPFPYRSKHDVILRANLPDKHFEILEELSINPEISKFDESGVYLIEDFDKDRKENKNFWKKKTSSKKSSAKKAKERLGDKVSTQIIEHDDFLTCLNMDDIKQVFERILNKRVVEEPEQIELEEEVEPTVPVEFPYRIDMSSFLEEREYTEYVDDTQYDYEQEEDEDALIAAALDRLNSRADVDGDPD